MKKNTAFRGLRKEMTYVLLGALIIMVIFIVAFQSMIKQNDRVDKELLQKFNDSRSIILTGLLYADYETAIFYNLSGMLVYDIKDRKIVRGLDFQKMGIDSIQGSEAYSILASKDGKMVFFRKPSDSKQFVYYIKENKLINLPPGDNKLFEPANYFNNFILLTEYMQKREEEVGVYYPISEVAQNSENDYVFLIHSSSEKQEGLQIVIDATGRYEVIPIFTEK